MLQLTYNKWHEFNEESILNLYYHISKSNSYLLAHISYDDFILFCYTYSSHYKY